MFEDRMKDFENNLIGTYGTDITSYDSGYVCDVFSEIADSHIDIYYSDIFEWAKGNTWYIDESMREYGNCNDIVKQIQMAQGYAYEMELYENERSILNYYAYNYLKEREVKLTEEQLDELESYISTLDNNSKLEDINDYCDDLNIEEEPCL